MKHAPASRMRSMPGTELPTLRNALIKEPETPEQAEKQAYAESQAECEAKIEELRASDKLGEIMDHAPYVEDQSITQVWGLKAAGDAVAGYVFKRWYFMGKDNAIVDTFMTEELYDAADVEGRRKLAHKYGTRYAALGPMHSRYPHKDAKLRKEYPSMQEQLAEKF